VGGRTRRLVSLTNVDCDEPRLTGGTSFRTMRLRLVRARGRIRPKRPSRSWRRTSPRLPDVRETRSGVLVPSDARLSRIAITRSVALDQAAGPSLRMHHAPSGSGGRPTPIWRIRGRSACWPWHLLRADGGAPLGLREVLSSEASPGYLAGGVILGACWRARAMLVIAVSAIAAMPISAAVV
jgi:hypothetical protein